MGTSLDRPFKMIVFDWDGTAVASRREDASAVRERLERLLQLGVRIVVITGTNFANVDHQLSAAIQGPHKQLLYICTNRGSEVYGFDAQSQPAVLYRRVATAQEDRLLTAVADRIREAIVSSTGLPIDVIYDRLNRRKIDLISLPEWQDPPKEAMDDLLKAVERRLTGAGLAGGLHKAIAIAYRMSQEMGLKEARITSDVKHIEVGLTNKGDSVDWAMREIAAPANISPAEVLIVGDEFGPVAGFPGSDAMMVVDSAKGAIFVSVGVEPAGVPPGIINLGGGPNRFRELLDEQIALHIAGETKSTPLAASAFSPTADSRWVLVEEGFNPRREHEIESLFSTANGYVGTRGAAAEGTPISRPATFIAGVFDSGNRPFRLPELVVAPDWTRLRVMVGGEELRLDRGKILDHRRTLDLRRGILLREWRHRDSAGRITHLSFLRCASLADRHVLVQAIALTPQNYTERVQVDCRIDGQVTNFGGARHLAVTTPTASLLVARTLSSDITLALATKGTWRGACQLPVDHAATGGEEWLDEHWEWEAYIGDRYTVDKLVGVATSRDGQRPDKMASALSDLIAKEDVEHLLAEHEQAWAARWEMADVVVAGDTEAQRSLRFALYHLIGAANPHDDRVSVGARDLSGEAYKGHVFWDTEIYMLPFYTFTYPRSARALLMYRYHTLPAARARALAMGFQGALYAWESAGTGEDATPPFVTTPTGEVIPIHSRLREHHISADVAYGVWQYWRATGDDDFFLEAGAEIMLEVARFWASRAALEEDRLYHIRHVIGPDEYHEDVDDNAYTNLMAQWALKRGAEVAETLQGRWPGNWRELSARLQLEPDEIGDWRTIASHIAMGYDPVTGLFEQFAGYFSLEDVDVSAYEPRTAPMDVLLGHERIKETQVIKQADVVLLIYLLWDRLPAEVRAASFRYYEPRTGHGSSLSPCIYALVAARLGDDDLGMKYFKQSAEIDLANNMGNAAEGVHMGALGGLWQAAVFGFAGMLPREDGLVFDPHIPTEWGDVHFPVQWRGRSLRVAISASPPAIEVVLDAGSPMVVAAGERVSQTIEVGKRFRSRLAGGGWTAWEEEPL